MSTWNRVSPVNASDNGDGGRVKKTATSGGNTTTTTYVGKLYVCEGSSWAKMIFAGGQRIAIKQVGSGSISDFHPDHLGSTSILTHASGVRKKTWLTIPMEKPIPTPAPPTSRINTPARNWTTAPASTFTKPATMTLSWGGLFQRIPLSPIPPIRRLLIAIPTYSIIPCGSLIS